MKRPLSRRIWLACAITLASCGGKPEAAPTPEPQAPVSVRVEAAAVVETASELELVGSVAARTRSVVSSKVAGRIERIHAAEGQSVRAGAVLVELDRAELEAAVETAEASRAAAETAVAAADQEIAAAEAKLALAEATHRRFEQLLEKESVSRQEYDEAAANLRTAVAAVELGRARRAQAEAAITAAQAGVKQQALRRDEAVIRAPVSGVVTARLADPGTLATPGAPLLEIEPASGFRLEVAVPETQALQLKRGSELRVEIPALGEAGPDKARVAEIVPAVDAASRTFTVKLALPSTPGLRSGLFGRAFLAGAPAERLEVPAGAVIVRGQVRSVFVVADGRAERRLVTLGELRQGRYEVLSGLDAGERVVVQPAELRDGTPVAVQGGP